MSYSKTIIVGNLTKDPELGYTPNQTPVCNGGIAQTEKWKGKDGATNEDTCFLDWVAFGKPAEVLNQYLKKGDAVLLEGRLTQDRWDDKETGAKRSKHKLKVREFAFMGKKQAQGTPAAPAGAPDENIPF